MKTLRTRECYVIHLDHLSKITDETLENVKHIYHMPKLL